MTEQEFYELRIGDEVEFNGDRSRFAYNFNVNTSFGNQLFAKMFKHENRELYVYQYGDNCRPLHLEYLFHFSEIK